MSLPGGVDLDAAMRLVKERLSQISSIKTPPGPEVTVVESSGAGPVLGVSLTCESRDYDQVQEEANRIIWESKAALEVEGLQPRR
jgi:hypothetical protein